MTATAPRPVPDAHDPLMAPFWEATRRRVLVVQQCRNCGQLRFPPLPVCSNCWSEDQTWTEIEPYGTVWSYVVYHRALNPAFKDDVPYAIGRVKSDAGPTFTVRLDIPLTEITVDMRVRASYTKISDEISLLEFTQPGPK